MAAEAARSEAGTSITSSWWEVVRKGGGTQGRLSLPCALCAWGNGSQHTRTHTLTHRVSPTPPRLMPCSAAHSNHSTASQRFVIHHILGCESATLLLHPYRLRERRSPRRKSPCPALLHPTPDLPTPSHSAQSQHPRSTPFPPVSSHLTSCPTPTHPSLSSRAASALSADICASESRYGGVLHILVGLRQRSVKSGGELLDDLALHGKVCNSIYGVYCMRLGVSGLTRRVPERQHPNPAQRTIPQPWTEHHPPNSLRLPVGMEW